MGRLSGFKYREAVRRLRQCGFAFDRQGPGSHEVWRHTVRAGAKWSFLIMPVTWLKERYAPSSVKQVSMLRTF